MQASCDLLIIGARVIDGSGTASQFIDVAIDRDRIVDLGDCRHWQADTELYASGLVLAPGFIDSHTHDDLAVLKSPDIPFKISQGVTTVIAGNCGISLAPLRPGNTMPPPFPLLGETSEFCFPSVKSYCDALIRAPSAVNLALLAGHSSLRLGSMADRLDQCADPIALQQMCADLRLALRQGCIGLSTGLDYPPAAAASTDEVVQLASVLREFEHAVYATHMRDEGDQVLAAVEETLDIGRRAAVPVVISHHKCAGPNNYGRSRQTLELIDRARSAKQAVSLDVYPYIASSTSLLAQFAEDCEAVLVSESTPHPECNGLLLERIVADWECSLEETCERLYPATAIYFQMDENDLQRIMAHPAAMIGSDGIASMQTPHPRLWGSFPRVLGHYVREKKLFELETAVHKMTGLTASRFGLENRGSIAIGNYGDLVLFDPDTVMDRASFEDPAQISDGIISVWVNGKLSWHEQQSTGTRNGRFLTH
jgi:N-acyl-D-aspartate/D-glutamate deacylase